jgi:hypothetical protein
MDSSSHPMLKLYYTNRQVHFLPIKRDIQDSRLTITEKMDFKISTSAALKHANYFNFVGMKLNSTKSAQS